MSPSRTLLAALPALALILAGCGGGGGDESTEAAPVATIPTTTALSKAELIDQGDAICAEVNAAVGTVDSTSAETGAAAGQVADLYSGMVQSLKGLGTPQEAAGYSDFSEAADELAQTESEVKLASARGDEAALTSAESSAASALESFQSAAREYGFEQCAEGPSAPTTSPGTSEVAPEETESGVEAEPEAAPEEAPEATPETGGAGGAVEGGGTGGGTEGGGGTSGGGSGGIGPG